MNVLVYAGRGTSELCVRETLASLRSSLGRSYEIKSIDASTLNGAPWETNCALLVMPGGRDTPYTQDITAMAINRIRKWIREAGGSYLGICAGAYFACEKIEFDRGGPLEIVGPRDLGVFPGTAIGPIGAPFVYDSHQGATAERIIRSDNGEAFRVYSNGGCHFEAGPEAKPDILAAYGDGRPALVSVQVGKGRVVLIGNHPEFQASSLDTIKNELPFDLELLRECEGARISLWNTVMRRLGLHIGAENSASSAEIENPTPLRLYSFSSKLAMKLFPIQTFEYNAGGPADSVILVSDDSPSADMSFDPRIFFKALGECSLGRPMIYAERIISTQTLLRDNHVLLSGLPDGTICLAGDQLAGKGRGANTWLSSTGCLQFTLLKMHCRADGALPLIQYLAALAVCEAVNPGRANPDLDVRIKWPNDLYARRKGETDYRKTGGILVNSSQDLSDPDFFHVLIGIGVNVRDTPWTICLNDVMASHGLPPLTKELLFARILTAFERLYNQMAALGGAFPTTLYYKHWLHTGQSVLIQDDQEQQMRVCIEGIDGNGYLMVRSEATAGLQTLLYEGRNFGRQSHILLQPDGNSFDMMKGLIKKKN